jgi:hypothetical protein
MITYAVCCVVNFYRTAVVTHKLVSKRAKLVIVCIENFYSAGDVTLYLRITTIIRFEAKNIFLCTLCKSDIFVRSWKFRSHWIGPRFARFFLAQHTKTVKMYPNDPKIYQMPMKYTKRQQNRSNCHKIY